MRPASEARPGREAARQRQDAATVAAVGRQLLVAEGPAALTVERVAALAFRHESVVAHHAPDAAALLALVLARWHDADPLRTRVAAEAATYLSDVALRRTSQ